MPSVSYEEWERIFEERSVDNTARAMARFGEVAGAQTEMTAILVALGSRRYSGFTRFLLGSISYAVASHASCSVEIVRKAILQEGEK